MDFLLACLSPRPDLAGLRGLAEKPGLDWDATYQLARRNGIVGIVAPLLHEILGGKLPDSPQAPWLSQWRKLAMNDMVQWAALEEILLAAQGRSLRPVLLKGFSVDLQTGFRESCRGASDIDLLVEPSCFLSMAKCLQGAGFTFLEEKSGFHIEWEADPGTAPPRGRHEALFHRSKDGVFIDLHWQIHWPSETERFGLKLSDRIWERTRPVRVGRSTGTLLGREEELLYLCYLLFIGDRWFFRRLWDLGRLLEAPAAIDWERLLPLSVETGTASLAHYGFGLLIRISPGSVPVQVTRGLSRWRGPHRILSPALRLERLLLHQGWELSNLSIRWTGVRYAQRLWRWPFHILRRMVSWLTRRVDAVSREGSF
ncbi:MAG: nucleotidyltransferase family protein [Candidatus Omnitrophica bacterium]|nr:nucleotidyltransferase family protein [Candidatus Omnitrophota bacterium]